MNITYSMVNGIDELRRIARLVHRLDEADCNSDFNPRRNKKRDKLLQAAAKIAAEEFDAVIYHHGDPRGCGLYLCDKENANNQSYTHEIALF